MANSIIDGKASRALGAAGCLLLAALAAACASCASTKPASEAGSKDGPRDHGVHETKPSDGRADRNPLAVDFGLLPDIDPSKCPKASDAGPAPAVKPSLSGVTVGSVVWDTEVPGSAGVLVGASIAARDGRIYIAAARFGHLALDDQGKLLWTQIPQVPSYQRIYTWTHVTAAGLVSLLATPGKIQLRRLDTGNDVWSKQVPGPFGSGFTGIAELSWPVVTLPGGSLAVGGAHVRLTGIAAGGQQFLFDRPVHGMIHEAGLVADGTRIFSGHGGTGRVAAYALDGTPLWERDSGPAAKQAMPALGPAGGLIALGAPVDVNIQFTTTVSLFDRQCGALRWRKTHDGAWTFGNAVRVGVHGEVAVLASQRKSFLRIHTYGANGAKLWTHSFEPTWPWRFPWEDGSVVRIFGPVGADNTLHVLRCQVDTAGWRNLLEGFDIATGKRRYRAELPFFGCVGEQAVLLDNGLLVTTAQDIKKNVHVVAIQTASPGLAASPWPTYCANNARTCNDVVP